MWLLYESVTLYLMPRDAGGARYARKPTEDSAADRLLIAHGVHCMQAVVRRNERVPGLQYTPLERLALKPLRETVGPNEWIAHSVPRQWPNSLRLRFLRLHEYP